jgi:prepilin-type N-terminal cleavage/methylation domain-containing protein
MNGTSGSPLAAADSSVQPRRGFSLIELLVALVLLDVGLLALVGLGTTITREADGGRAALKAIATAQNRLERLASVGCGAVVHGSTVPSSGMVEVFDDVPAANATRLLRDSVTVTTSRGPSIVALGTGARC